MFVSIGFIEEIELVRFIASLLFLFPASAVVAQVPPGPPPWSCSLVAACNVADVCIPLHAIPMRLRFKLTQVDGDARRYHLEGNDGFEDIALELPSLEDAKHFAETYSSNEPTPLMLIRNDRVFDAHGFWLQAIWRRGGGGHVVADEKMLVACDSIR